MAKKNQKSQGVKLAIRQAGEGGITKQELNNIAKTTGASTQTVVKRLDQVNQNLKSNDSARIGLNSGAANMLIKQNSKNPTINPFMPSPYGSGKIGKTLSSMMGTTSQPGFNPGGNPTKNRMIGGTQIRGGGNIAVRGFGQQYELPKTKILNPIDLETGSNRPTSNTDPVVTDPVVQEPMTPEQMQEASTVGSGMMSGGGMGAAGASKLGRANSRLRKLGIYGRGTGLLGRGLQYGNSLNA
ncbi:head-to-tail connector [Synechococcus phage S-SRP01]|uniref:Head-to-tail connector n=1 Tax=Synechococcus phage S-SRP01 TaxID=2781607 RepID=A0A874MFT1_9CAUD|nr:head-to-tail connector [Synechococcus phage S-SRP01]